METRTFALADALSATTGTLLSRNGMPGLCDLVEWLTHEQPFIVSDKPNLRRFLAASAKARDLLILQQPWLIDLRPPEGIGNGELFDWLRDAEDEHGLNLTLTRESVMVEALTEMTAALDAGRRALIDLAALLAEDPPERGDEEGNADV
jgi:hypothetical protein